MVTESKQASTNVDDAFISYDQSRVGLSITSATWAKLSVHHVFHDYQRPPLTSLAVRESRRGDRNNAINIAANDM